MAVYQNPTALAAALRINYRVYYASSEDPEYPAQLVQVDFTKNEEQQRTAPGWQTKKFCQYPQEIILQLMNPGKVKQLQILSHQYKISQRVEIFCMMPASALDPAMTVPIRPDDYTNFVKIGYFSFDENLRTEYQAREMKTVHLDSMAQYIKLVFYQPFENKLNIFQQVGIVSIQVIGETIGSMAKQALADKFQNGITFPVPNIDQTRLKYLQIQTTPEFDLDPVFQDKIIELRGHRDKAVEIDDFDRARFLRDAMDKVKEYGVKVVSLMELKRLAIENEDYETAKKIKLEVEMIKNAVRSVDPKSGMPYVVAPISNIETTSPIRQKSPVRFDDQPLKPASESPEVIKSKFEAKRVSYQSDIPRGVNKHDEEVIPTLKNNKKTLEQQIAEYEESLKKKGIPLDPNRKIGPFDENDPMGVNESPRRVNAHLAQQVAHFFDFQLVQRLQSPLWQQRESAIFDINQNLLGYIQMDGYDQAMNALILMLLDEKNPQIAIQTITLIESVMTTTPDFRFDNQDKVLAYLLDRLGDPRQASRAEQTFLKYVELHSTDFYNLVAFLVSKHSFYNVQSQNSPKLINKRLLVLLTLTEEMEHYAKTVGKPNPATGYPYPEVYRRLAKTIDHPTLEIRQTSLKIVMEIYKKQGFDMIKEFIAQLPNDILENLIKFIPEVEPYMKMNEEQMKAARKTNAYGGGGSFGWAPNLQDTQQKGSPSKGFGKKSPANKVIKPLKVPKADPQEKYLDPVKPKKVEGGMCQFCEIEHTDFFDSEKLDAHYLNECSMLTTCPGCQQIIEISQYTQHLLKECQNKIHYQACKTCKEAFHKFQLRDHQAQGDCNPAKPASQAQRCPLCHRDIGLGDRGWKDHLLVNKCPKNDRLNPPGEVQDTFIQQDEEQQDQHPDNYYNQDVETEPRPY